MLGSAASPEGAAEVLLEVGDVLDASVSPLNQKGRYMGIYRGIGSLAFAVGATAGGQIADRLQLSSAFFVCGILYLTASLVALTVFLVGAFAFQDILDLIRSRIVVRAAALLDQRLGDTVHRSVLALGVRGGNAAEAHQPIRDLDQIRAFMTSAGPTAIVDLPWIPFFLAICFLIHPWIGLLALAGAIVLVSRPTSSYP